MNVRSPLVVLAALLLLPLSGYSQSIALTFDDGLNPVAHAEAPAWNAAILAALANAKIKSILFPAGKNVDSPQGMALVRDWGAAGHQIGNHTYSHHSLGADETTLDWFIADAKRAQALLNPVAGWTPRFRFPFLSEGNTAMKRDGFRHWLEQNGYKSGVVSVDASDWYYNDRYLKWLSAHPSDNPTKFRDAYLDHLWNRAQYYNGLSLKLLHRSIKHVLLLHTNAINAAFLPDIISMFRMRGWTIIGPDEAFRDPVYAQRTQVLPAGQSILWSLAKRAGYTDLRFPAEDDVYEKPILDGLGL